MPHIAPARHGQTRNSSVTVSCASPEDMLGLLREEAPVGPEAFVDARRHDYILSGARL